MTLHMHPAEAASLGDTLPALPLATVMEAAQAAQRQIPPAFPLAATVAVNPFLGQTGMTLAQTAAKLARLAGVRITPPRSVFAAKLAEGDLTREDIAQALAASPEPLALDVRDVIARLSTEPSPPKALPTVAALATALGDWDFEALVTGRMGAFCAALFDEGQALWPLAKGRSVYATWQMHGSHDLTPEIMGLTGFGSFVAAAPDTAQGALLRAVTTLGLTGEALESCFHQLLLGLGGWAQAARYRLWEAELSGGTDATLLDLLAIRLVWEEALFLHLAGQGSKGDAALLKWRQTAAAHAQPALPTEDMIIDAVLQEAAERAAQRKLACKLAARKTPIASLAVQRSALQAAFCIDVRSEVFRRALESLDPAVRTLGFAGFFGIGTSHRGFASSRAEKRMPVLLQPARFSCSTPEGAEKADRTARIAARAKRAFGRFRQAAVSSFAFVEAAGPLYAAKLIKDALLPAKAAADATPAPRFDPPLAPDQAVATAATVLRAMSLTQGFARIVLIAGHGSDVRNNLHSSALQCGACGGHSGEVNARLLAGLLNDPAVRAGLKSEGISIPEDTLFLAALHDTASDGVSLYEGDVDTSTHVQDLAQLKDWLAAAGALARAERAEKLPGAEQQQAVGARARDWAQTRPEWGLAGCAAFIAAPRQHSAGADLGGRVFLHDYVAARDEGFRVLELILTAPVVVASWISLQYYGSAVVPQLFGAGNKLLHNAAGGMGVVEGNGGLLRTGLTWQSVHDGDKLMHEPLRLTVMVEAPEQAVLDILSRHPGVRALFDQRWLHLLLLDETGKPVSRYAGGLSFTPLG